MRYSFRSLRMLALPVYLLLVIFTPMPWLTNPRGSPRANQACERTTLDTLERVSQRLRRDVSSLIPFNREGSWFREGDSEPSNQTHTQALVISRLANDNVSWVSTYLSHVNRYIYTANEAGIALHTPQNKGHEAMVYLSHIVENYDELADINIFMHKDRFTFHNEGHLGFDAVKMIHRLRGAYVVRNGYTNLQCGWAKSCPTWLNSSETWPRIERQEQVYLTRVWRELFPGDRIPGTLAAPCCAQFAVSKERIRAVPLAKYVFMRDWLLRTPLTDYISGRLWEYLWHYLFTGEHVRCPLTHVCLCEGYGLCFGGEEGYLSFEQLGVSKAVLQKELDEWYGSERTYREVHRRNGSVAGTIQPPPIVRGKFLKQQILAMEKEEEDRLNKAVARGHRLVKHA